MGNFGVAKSLKLIIDGRIYVCRILMSLVLARIFCTQLKGWPFIFRMCSRNRIVVSGESECGTQRQHPVLYIIGILLRVLRQACSLLQAIELYMQKRKSNLSCSRFARFNWTHNFVGWSFYDWQTFLLKFKSLCGYSLSSRMGCRNLKETWCIDLNQFTCIKLAS